MFKNLDELLKEINDLIKIEEQKQERLAIIKRDRIVNVSVYENKILEKDEEIKDLQNKIDILKNYKDTMKEIVVKNSFKSGILIILLSFIVFILMSFSNIIPTLITMFVIMVLATISDILSDSERLRYIKREYSIAQLEQELTSKKAYEKNYTEILLKNKKDVLDIDEEIKKHSAKLDLLNLAKNKVLETVRNKELEKEEKIVQEKISKVQNMFFSGEDITEELTDMLNSENLELKLRKKEN